MLSTPTILERLYRVPKRRRRERLLEIQQKIGRWLESQRWSAAVLISVTLIFCLAGGYYYNMLFSLESNVQAAHAKIEAGQQRRNHIKRNLVQLLLFYARYEQGLMKDLTAMRSQGQKSGDTGRDVMGLLGRLNAVAEQYPTLHLTNTVELFMNGTVATESEIASYIINYNETVNIYRTTKKSFPAKIFSAMLGFKDYPFYQPEDPKVLPFKELNL